MKRFAWFLVFLMLFGCLAGCGKKDIGDDTLNAATESVPLEDEFEHAHGPDEHIYQAEVMSDPDCVNSGITVHICAICGEGFEEITEPFGHELEPATCVEKGYCVNCGIVMEKPTGHSTKTGICERCGEFVG